MGMNQNQPSDIRRAFDHSVEMTRFWLLALVVGLFAGAAAILFRSGIENIQAWLYDAPDVTVLKGFVSALGWYWIVGIPTFGGLLVGIGWAWVEPRTLRSAPPDVRTLSAP